MVCSGLCFLHVVPLHVSFVFSSQASEPASRIFMICIQLYTYIYIFTYYYYRIYIYIHIFVLRNQDEPSATNGSTTGVLLQKAYNEGFWLLATADSLSFSGQQRLTFFHLFFFLWESPSPKRLKLIHSLGTTKKSQPHPSRIQTSKSRWLV